MPFRTPSAAPKPLRSQDPLSRERAAYITKAARSVTVANVIAPLLCYVAFQSDADPQRFRIWLIYMFVATVIRTFTTGRLEHQASQIGDPQVNLKWVTLGVGLIGFGWGLGWWLLVPDLGMENRLLYLFITTGGMFNSMFAYCVYWPAFFSFTVPVMVPAILTVLTPRPLFHWTVSAGLFALFFYFSQSYEDSLRLRLRNEKLYQELATERDVSVAANTAKSSFIASASHDLRQPMHAVNIYLDSLKMDKIPEAEQQTIQKIKSSITTLNEMFESLLNISKLDSLTYRPVHQPFSLDLLGASLEEIARPLAAQKGLDIRFSGEQGVVRGDLKALQQIMMNLIANAIHFTEQGHIDVTWRSERHQLVLSVQDTGRGIEADDQAKIFNEFYRVDETRPLHDGLGLGLSIVKRLCQLIGALITVASERGQGANFTVHTAYPVHHDASLPLDNVSHAPPPDNSQSLHGKVVAVIEDDPTVREAYRQTLASKGAMVVVLPDDPQNLLRELELLDHLDLIVSDFRLRTTTGDALIQTLREAFNREVPAILVTADTSPAHIDRFAQMNIPVLHKPVSFQQIIDSAEKALTSAEPDGNELKP
jgi:signal transduction histidine kinase/CheY-like chemotaxis protein